jgi:hypothetical protein
LFSLSCFLSLSLCAFFSAHCSRSIPGLVIKFHTLQNMWN